MLKQTKYYLMHGLIFLFALCLMSSSLTANAQCGPISAGMPQPSITTPSFCNFSPVATSIPSTTVTAATDYTFLITDSQQLDSAGDPIIIGTSDNGIFDFTNFPEGNYCFHGFAYNQVDLDNAAQFFNDNPTLAPLFGIPADNIPLALPWTLEDFLAIGELFGDLTIPNLEGAIDLLGTLNLSICTAIATPYCLDNDSTNGSCCAVIDVEEACLMAETFIDLTAEINNGTAPYTYAWSDGTTTTISQNTHVISAMVSQASTNYSVTITDANNCVAVAQTTITIPNSGTVEAPSASSFCFESPAVEGLPSSLVTGLTDYAFLITNSQQLDDNGDPIVVGTSSNGIFDFTNFPPSNYCFQGFAYNQADLDNMSIFFNANPALAGVVGIPAEDMPLSLPLPVEDFLSVLAGLVGDLTIPSINNGIDLLGSLNLSICTDTATPYCLRKTCAIPNSVFQVKVYLEGAYGGGNYMNPPQNSQNPTNQPFNTGPWNYNDNGNESNVSVPIYVVDWVLVELWDANDINTVIQRRAALLYSDGSIVDVDGLTNGVQFSDAIIGSAYYVVVRSRNHLDVMSSTPVQVNSNNTAVYDFTSSINQAAGQGQQTLLEPNIAGLHAGDVNGNGVITVEDYNDYETWLNNNTTVDVYTNADVDLDANVTISDFNTYQTNASIIGIPLIRY